MPRAIYTAHGLRALCWMGLGVLVLAACSSDSSAPARDEATTLRMGSGGEPKSLDPQIVTGLIEERLLSSMFEGLVNIDFETMQPVPGVAEEWYVSLDETVYVFELRKDARWSNGDPVTAHDFVYSWRRILSPGLAAEYAYMLYPIENAEAFNRGDLTDFSEVGVRALGDRTLEVTLRAPTPYFFALQIHFTFYPVHQATIEAHGGMLERDTHWTRPGNLVSNGPFTLTAWSPNKEIVVSKNPHYWDRDAVQLETIVFRPIQNPTVEERIFRAGEIDLTYGVPLTKIPTYLRDHPELIRIDPYIATEFIRFNTTRKPFDDPRVRNALALAIDRDTIVSRVLKGGQEPATSFTPPNTGGYTYHADTAASGPRYAPGEARRLLAEAGYPDGRGFPEVTLLHDTNDNVRIYCEAVQNMWKKELNIAVQLQTQDGKTWLSNMIALNYDLARSFWAADYPDPSNFLEIFFSNTGNNRTGFNNPAYEDLLRRGAAERKIDERNYFYNSAESILLSDAPITPVYHQTRAYLVSPNLQGLKSNNLGRISYKDLSLTP
ncbi:MAG: peptide ABC transporter substrate-binding protein [Candidatus Hydrogenedentes bacterium]|nr:peptide ABC transporter substrate-binding protein [Candidatus Hydrogenedentota bacterium]